MKQILITGATGNVGYEVIRFLEKNKTPNKIIAGVRNIESAKKVLKDFLSNQICFLLNEQTVELSGGIS